MNIVLCTPEFQFVMFVAVGGVVLVLLCVVCVVSCVYLCVFCGRVNFVAVVVVIAIVMSSFQVVFLSLCRPVVVPSVASSSRVAVMVAVVPRSSCWCRFLVLLSPCRLVVVLVLVRRSLCVSS